MNDSRSAHGGKAGAFGRPSSLAVLACGLSVAIAIPTAVGQQAGDPQRQRGEAVKQLETSKDTLKQTERRVQSLQTDVQQLNAEQARVNEQLIETGRLAQQSEARLSQIEARLGELDAQEKLIRGSLVARHDRIAKLFSAMQRMGRNPPPVIVTQREDALRMVRSAMLLARAFPELKQQADELSARLLELVRVMNEARSEGERLRSESARLTDARTRLAALMESKRRSLSDRQKELEEVRRTAAEVARSVNDLSDLVGRLDKAVAQNTALAEYDRELKEREEREAKDAAAAAAAAPPPQQQAAVQQPAQPATPLPGARPTTQPQVPVPPVRPSVADSPQQPVTAEAGKDGAKDGNTQVAALPKAQPPRLTFEPHAGAMANAGRMKPAIPFHLAKGQLPLPALGKRILAFGDKTQFGRISRGIAIETRHSATVIAPADGWIVYSGEFRSFGQVLIINVGGGYHVFMTNLARTDVEVGRFVLAGEPVGAMSPNVVGTSNAAPILYVEFRNKDGQPIDPTPWWADGSQKVQG